MVSLTDKLEQAFVDLEISSEKQGSILHYLELIKDKDKPTWAHSVRVGLKGIEVAEYSKILNPKALFYSGVLHDIGKYCVNSESLKKKEGFNQQDMEELKKHPLNSYLILKDIHHFSARVALFHHYFSEQKYPEELPEEEIKEELSSTEGDKTNVLFYARILNLIDFYDAAKTRKNEKFSDGIKKMKTSKEVKILLIEFNPDQEYLIESLYEGKIFE
jgi:response regulator RpfG family c-di-GMP phosphodiesterase